MIKSFINKIVLCTLDTWRCVRCSESYNPSLSFWWTGILRGRRHYPSIVVPNTGRTHHGHASVTSCQLYLCCTALNIPPHHTASELRVGHPSSPWPCSSLFCLLVIQVLLSKSLSVGQKGVCYVLLDTRWKYVCPLSLQLILAICVEQSKSSLWYGMMIFIYFLFLHFLSVSIP